MERVISSLRENWGAPRTAMHRGEECPFLLGCRFSDVGGDDTATGKDPATLPSDVRAFWANTESARLFEDSQYGQWGLEIVAPDTARELTESFKMERANDYREGDLIIGRFLGDADLLVVRCDPQSSDHGSVLVALPLDPREEWYSVAPGLQDFIEQYERAEGDKYWEA